MYHFSRIYFSPCAVSIEKGRIKKIAASGLKLVIKIVKSMRSDAIELREAKKPLVVEKSPIKIIAKVGRLIIGER